MNLCAAWTCGACEMHELSSSPGTASKAGPCCRVSSSTLCFCGHTFDAHESSNPVQSHAFGSRLRCGHIGCLCPHFAYVPPGARCTCGHGSTDHDPVPFHACEVAGCACPTYHYAGECSCGHNWACHRTEVQRRGFGNGSGCASGFLDEDESLSRESSVSSLETPPRATAARLRPASANPSRQVDPPSTRVSASAQSAASDGAASASARGASAASAKPASSTASSSADFRRPKLRRPSSAHAGTHSGPRSGGYPLGQAPRPPTPSQWGSCRVSGGKKDTCFVEPNVAAFFASASSRNTGPLPTAASANASNAAGDVSESGPAPRNPAPPPPPPVPQGPPAARRPVRPQSAPAARSSAPAAASAATAPGSTVRSTATTAAAMAAAAAAQAAAAGAAAVASAVRAAASTGCTAEPMPGASSGDQSGDGSCNEARPPESRGCGDAAEAKSATSAPLPQATDPAEKAASSEAGAAGASSQAPTRKGQARSPQRPTRPLSAGARPASFFRRPPLGPKAMSNSHSNSNGLLGSRIQPRAQQATVKTAVPPAGFMQMPATPTRAGQRVQHWRAASPKKRGLSMSACLRGAPVGRAAAAVSAAAAAAAMAAEDGRPWWERLHTCGKGPVRSSSLHSASFPAGEGDVGPQPPEIVTSEGEPRTQVPSTTRRGSNSSCPREDSFIFDDNDGDADGPLDDGTGATGAYFGVDSDEEEGATGGAPVSTPHHSRASAGYAQAPATHQGKARPMSAPYGKSRTTEEWARETLQRLRLEQLRRMAEVVAAEKYSGSQASFPAFPRSRPRSKSRMRRARR